MKSFRELGIYQRFADPQNSVWALTNQAFARFSVGLKFFLVAAYLGPAAVGQIGVALLVLAVSEAITDTGLQQAILQKHHELSAIERGTAWKILAFRGCAVSAVLYLFDSVIAVALSSPSSRVLIDLVSLAPLLRNFSNLGLLTLPRRAQFRRVTKYEVILSALDFTLTMCLVAYGVGPAAVIVGTLAADLIRCILSWTKFREPQVYSGRLLDVKHIVSYGKWIWLSNVANVLINQIDKVIVVKLLGDAQLGTYQLAMKVIQLVLFDWVYAYCTYLFPVLSKVFHDSAAKAKRFYAEHFRKLALINIILSLILLAASAMLTRLYQDSKWHALVSLVPALLFSGYVSAAALSLTTLCRAVALPKAATYATPLHLLLLVICLPTMVSRYGTTGAAVATGLGSAVSVLSMFLLLRIFERQRLQQ